MKPLILVTNDDGISAPGLRALVDVMTPFGKVIVIAPDKPQSGTGHAITINSGLWLEKVRMFGGNQEYTCSGTPVDCVKIGVHKILKCKPDLCVSGINHGSNSSINVIYSGTMSAALEGAIEGIPSIGFSLCNESVNADFTAARKFAGIIATTALKNSIPEGVCLNVNIPLLEEHRIRGIKVCRQANAYWREHYEERNDKEGKTYFWLTGKFENLDPGKDTDEWALKHNFISIVPVHADVTAHASLQSFKKWKFTN